MEYEYVGDPRLKGLAETILEPRLYTIGSEGYNKIIDNFSEKDVFAKELCVTLFIASKSDWEKAKTLKEEGWILKPEDAFSDLTKVFSNVNSFLKDRCQKYILYKVGFISPESEIVCYPILSSTKGAYKLERRIEKFAEPNDLELSCLYLTAQMIEYRDAQIERSEAARQMKNRIFGGSISTS